ncbi:elongation factor P 5-aminopentanone reductase [Peptostreptococcus stomatis]|uniref:elongation factor P 5-aminopentanone reductase n=1 Tax=Peptostreptococcus stomatis TaxID=341694 RepID=UPI003F9EE4DB
MSKVVLVTGGSRGIGRQVAIQLAKEGYRLLINYNKSQKEAQETCRFLREEGYQVEIFKADVSKQDQVKAMFDFCMDRFGSIDVLVNNSGISYEGLITDMDEEDWDRIIDTNLKSVFLCSKEALKHMISNHSGKIINISSMWGQVGASCEVAYSASKAGMIGFTKALAKEVGPSGINVNALAPGVIMTDMMKDFDQSDIDYLKDETPLMRLGQPEDIANLVSFLVSDKADFITGQVLASNGGFVI